MTVDLTKPAADPALWPLDPSIEFLNHGSFGSCPKAILGFQSSLRDHLERQPVRFFVRELEGYWDRARQELGQFVGADANDLVFVPNATAGVNTVLRSLRFHPGDELLVTNHEYNACRNALDYVAGRSGANVVVADVPFPCEGPQQVIEAIVARATGRTRLALVDHVTSQTGLVLPIHVLASELRDRGIQLLVDGAHAPGMVPLNLAALGATYYTGNCHKWICSPKGAGFLYVQRDRQAEVRPLVISHGANSLRADRSKFLIEFAWTGTSDPSAALSVPQALRHMSALRPSGWPEVMERNRSLALAARRELCATLKIQIPCPEQMIGALAAIPLPDSPDSIVPVSPLYSDPLQEELLTQFGIEVPIIPWPSHPKRILRISAQLYNSLPQYERLAAVLVELIER